MPVICETVNAPALVRYVFEGEWTASDLLERRRELVRAGHLTADSAVLFDLRLATTFPSLGDPQSSLDANATDAIWPVCRALLVSTEDQYRCARHLQALLGPHAVINEIFHDEAKAFEWLSAITARRHASRG